MTNLKKNQHQKQQKQPEKRNKKQKQTVQELLENCRCSGQIEIPPHYLPTTRP